MPHQNRVTPYGDIVVSALRGTRMGNRGCIHRGTEIVRGWATTRWITCVLEFKGWVAPKWEQGRWTALFFADEHVALAAGHRPCALCRRADFRAYLAATGLASAADVDTRLHAERLDGRRKRLHSMPWSAVPDGAFVALDGEAALVRSDAAVPWHPDTGYGDPVERPRRGEASVLTPETSVVALRSGYAPLT